MITLIEDTPNKLPGITSMFIKIENVSKDVLLDIVSVIKETCEIYNYDKKTYMWEVPLKNISILIDNLSVLDEISIISHQENKNQNLSLVDPLKFKTKPFEYQLEGINYGINHSKWLLLDDMGLGKTLQAIYVAQSLYEMGKIEHCLILCGVDSLRSNWKKEIEKHSNLSAMILGDRLNNRGNITYESVAYRVEQLSHKIDEFFIITTLTTIRNDDVVDALNSGINNIGLIITDEIHRCVSGNTIVKTNLGDMLIKDIVDNKIECKVLSFNFKTNKYEYKKILDYYNNGLSNNMFELEIEENGKIYKLKCTDNHKIFTKNRGFVLAKDLTEYDDIIVI